MLTVEELRQYPPGTFYLYSEQDSGEWQLEMTVMENDVLYTEMLVKNYNTQYYAAYARLTFNDTWSNEETFTIVDEQHPLWGQACAWLALAAMKGDTIELDSSACWEDYTKKEPQDV